MNDLSTLKNTRPTKGRKRVGRGNGSGLGKTCGRGHKGDGSRAGYKRRLGYEGGQLRLHLKLPQRGFSNARFRTEYETVNLYQIDQSFEDGDTVNIESLCKKGLISGKNKKVKLLGEGKITKKVSFEMQSISSGAREKLQKAKLSFTLDA
ncbi:MAG: 50S ribosomal protein L15 [Chlamydiae bacterium]|nr:50S ribosomal protein L15 [Chlamydiota bacterium]